MLTITIGGTESFDDGTRKFVIVGGRDLELEHSLVSLSKWEAEYERPFLGKEEKSSDEVLFYIKCMFLDPKTPEEILYELDEKAFKAVNEYLNAKMTATWFAEAPGAPRTSEVVTAELIYYWMTVFNIPFSCETWNLNRLFTLIRICNIKSAKPKKMSRGEAARRQREINQQRKAQLGTRG